MGLEQHIIAGVAVALGFALLIVLVPAFRQPRYACPLSIVAAAIFFWREFFGFVAVGVVAYALVCWLQGQPDSKQRWRLACLSIVALVVVFTLARLRHWDAPYVFPRVGAL